MTKFKLQLICVSIFSLTLFSCSQDEKDFQSHILRKIVVTLLWSLDYQSLSFQNFLLNKENEEQQIFSCLSSFL